MLAPGENRGIVPQKTSSLRRGAVINASNFRIAGDTPTRFVFSPGGTIDVSPG
jgi:hypothetical protein